MPTEPDRAGSELELLEQYLDAQREALLAKTEGLDREQLTRTQPPSRLTLGGLLHHLALAEEDWMEIHFAGRPDSQPFVDADWAADPDWQFRAPPELQPEELRERYREACRRSRAVVREATGLDQLSAKPVRGELFTLRWVLLHLIEETARHAGHADFLREAIDGSVG
ncbi:DUF664 domain-containing protein [Nocardioides cynanchi]|uniref:mycothiol transferase n=1 Tax=Nocardioides cynanchi TaxID=2558918 RepID=UPI0012462D40|nr:DUF664 domain-containing protein [Nocardioides cynanchi]